MDQISNGTTHQFEANAFVLRMKTGNRQDRVDAAIKSGDICIGWHKAGAQLLDSTLGWNSFRQVIRNEYHPDDTDFRQSGRDAGSLWRFIREMKEGDLVVVPHGVHFLVAKVTGEVRYDIAHEATDTAYRRKVDWLTKDRPMPRSLAHAPLQSRMKVRNACVNAKDLIGQINDAVITALNGSTPSFGADLRTALIEHTKRELYSGRMNDRGFEQLVAAVLRSLGVKDAEVVGNRREDKGADILGTFAIGSVCKLRLAVQAKQYRPEPPTGKEPVDELVRGMQAEGAVVGLVVTAGKFSAEAQDRCEKAQEDTGFHIELVDGEQLAAMIVDGGLSSIQFTKEDPE